VDTASHEIHNVTYEVSSMTVPLATKIDTICTALVERSWAVVPDFLDAPSCRRLVANIQDLQLQGLMRPAGVGQGERQQIAPEVRSDLIYWLDETNLTPPQAIAYEQLQTLQLALNRSLFFGLRSIEAHLTLYKSAGAYAKHVDNFSGTSARFLSCIIYLSADYQSKDGGQLRLYQPGTPTEIAAEIEPRGGTLACFLSEQVPHEVLTTNRERYSLTAWFRT